MGGFRFGEKQFERDQSRRIERPRERRRRQTKKGAENHVKDEISRDRNLIPVDCFRIIEKLLWTAFCNAQFIVTAPLRGGTDLSYHRRLPSNAVSLCHNDDS